MKRVNILSAFIGLSVLMFSCMEEGDYEKQVRQNDHEILSYLNENNIIAKRASNGLYFEELIENDGGEEPNIGDVVFIKYDLKTLDGNVVENGLEKITKFNYNWASILPNGFNHGVALMKKGERIRFYLPSYLSFNGYSMQDKFGPYENFIVEMELFDIKTESELFEWEIDSIDKYIDTHEIEGIESYTSGLYFKNLESGDGMMPQGYSQVKFHFIRKYLDGTVIEDTNANDPIDTRLNEGHLVEGLRQGILKMKEGGKSLLIMPSEIGFGSSIQVVPSFLREEFLQDKIIQTEVLPYTPILYEVELLEVN